MAHAIMHHDANGVSLGNEESDGAGKLQFSAFAGSDMAKSAKNRAAQKVAPRGHHIRRRTFNRRFSTMPTTFFTRIISPMAAVGSITSSGSMTTK